MADTKDAIYFAGFFDGEGCVAIYSQKYVVSLTNTDVRPLEAARNVWGGFISTQAAVGRAGAIQDLHRWQIYGHAARAFLEDIRPFVRVKGEQIDVYLTVLSCVPVHGQRYQGDAKALIAEAAMRLRSLKRGVA